MGTTVIRKDGQVVEIITSRNFDAIEAMRRASNQAGYLTFTPAWDFTKNRFAMIVIR